MQESQLLRPHKIKLLDELPKSHRTFFKWFLALTELNRPSFQCAEACKKCIEWAQKLGASHKTDKYGNILLEIPASKGLEKVPYVCVQGHLDIVSVGKFDEGGQVLLKLVDGWLTSGVSTIGADDGVAVAAMFSIIEMKDKFEHGPLEFLITLDEEVGLLGATKLPGPPWMKSRSLLNLDSEEWGIFFSSCAGSAFVFYESDFKRAPFKGSKAEVTVSGLMGGHTGLVIHENRGNAVKWIAHLLLEAKRAGVDLRLVSIEGGDKHNAIPDKATAIVSVSDYGKFNSTCQEYFKNLVHETKTIEKKSPKLDVKPSNNSIDPMDESTSSRAINLIASIYHGVFEMHPEIKGIVRTSQSLSICKTEDKHVSITVFARSNEDTKLKFLIHVNQALGNVAGVRCTIPPDEMVSSWPADLSSKITDVAIQAYKSLSGGKEPEITGVHAGLECGCIQGRGYSDLQCISFGPDVVGAHTVEEKCSVESACKFFDLTIGTIKQWAKSA